ncbi:MAG: prolyl oligopeptidase family serine peptidase [Comamonadaceae bacterium]
MKHLSSIARPLGAGLWALAIASGTFAAEPALPIAPVRDVVQVLHGVTVHDPYRYLENVKDPEVQGWLRAQGEVTRQTLDKIDLRERLQKRIVELSAATGDSINSVVRMPLNRVYYLKRAAGETQFKLMMRIGLEGTEKVLVDPQVDTQRTSVPHAVNYFVPSWDGKYLAYGMSAGGSEDASLYILNIDDGTAVGAPIPLVPENLVSWLPDSKSFTYNQLKVLKSGQPETETYLDSRVMWLKVGQPQSKAVAVFGPTVTRKLGLARLDVGKIIFSLDSKWMVARTTDTTLPEGFLFVAKAADLGQPDVAWKRISTYADKITDVALKGDDLYLMTYTDAPRNHVLRLDLKKPRLALARVVATPPKDGVLEEFSLNRDALVASIREGTSVGVRRFAPGDTVGEAITLPFAGAAAVHDDPAHVYSSISYSLSGWTQLPRAFVFDGKDSLESGLYSRVAENIASDVEVVEVKAPGHDGTLIPMTVLYKKGIKLDGNNPTLLNGYGAYGFSETARFSPSSMVWLEQGGVLAYANVRGSGVYGNDWYKAGFKTTKSNTWKDGVACAQYLIRQGYASPKTLAVTGGSAGGIFVGRAVTTAPELFAAAIFNVGMMDTIRSEESANGITNISEFGSVKNASEFSALLDMSTYHNIKDGTAYPAVLLMHGLNDPRVDVWESGKAAARLQAASSSGKPVLLRLDLQAGHGVGSTATQRYAEAADSYSFLLWQMGRAQLQP